jgi:hypothetical protein
VRDLFKKTSVDFLGSAIAFFCVKRRFLHEKYPNQLFYCQILPFVSSSLQSLLSRAMEVHYCILFFLFPVAGALNYLDPRIFNVQFYSNMYSDLQVAYGNDVQCVYLLFFVFTFISVVYSFCALIFLFLFPLTAYIAHWQSEGLATGRQAHLLFSAMQYDEFYPDLIVYNHDYVALATHYLSNGISEGRNGYAQVTINKNAVCSTVKKLNNIK